MNAADKEATFAGAKIGSGLFACLVLIFVIIIGSANALKLIVYVSRAAP
jgi:hypothetical protein